MHILSRRAAARPAPSTFTLIRRALTALLLSTVLIGTGSVAYAHDTLTDSSPAEGETLTEPPTQVRLTFSAEVLEMGAAAVVTDSDGATWEADDPTVEGTDVTVPLEDGLPNGSYEVSWRVTSSDGHPISGVIPFTVDAPDTETAPADPAPTTGADDAADETSEPAVPTTEDAATDSAADDADEAATSESADTAATDNGSATTEAADTAASDGGAASTTQDDDSGVPWVPIVIGLVVLVAAGGVFAVVRRRGADQ